MRFKTRHSLTFRLTLLFAVASTVVLLTLGYLIGHSVEKHFDELDMTQLNGKLDLTKSALSGMRPHSDLRALSERLHDSLAPHHGWSVSIFDLDKKLLYATKDSGYPPFLLHPGTDGKPSHILHWLKDGTSFRGISALAPTGMKDRPWVLVVISMDSSQHQHFMDEFTLTLWCFVALAALLMGLLGWVAARRGLTPLREMKRSVADVSANRLDQRVSADRFPSEMADLSETVNGMLARLENSFKRLSDFSSDIAHELRTPVSNLMTQTQVTLSQARTAAEYREILASNAEELDRMARMISDMLFLAQSDNGLRIPHVESILLEKEFEGLFEFYDALLEEKSVTLRIQGTAEMVGDKLMLRRAFSNLLSNAIRHTPPGGEVNITISRPQAMTIDVQMCNPGDISPEHLSRLFDRLYRVDPSRHSEGEGTGLGLAITKSIIEAHHGSIHARSEGGKVCLVMRFQEQPAATKGAADFT